MADGDLSEDDEKLARVFARGLKLREDEKAEEEAKAKAAADADKGKNDTGTSGDKQPKSWRERLLG